MRHAIGGLEKRCDLVPREIPVLRPQHDPDRPTAAGKRRQLPLPGCRHAGRSQWQSITLEEPAAAKPRPQMRRTAPKLWREVETLSNRKIAPYRIAGPLDLQHLAPLQPVTAPRLHHHAIRSDPEAAASHG